MAATVPFGRGVVWLGGGGPLLVSPLSSFLAWRGSCGAHARYRWAMVWRKAAAFPALRAALL